MERRVCEELFWAMIMNRTKILLLIAALASGCQENIGSDISVTDVKHTEVKDQSIGNCWLYASAAWAESLHLAATGSQINISESYWTYWDWYEELLGHPYSIYMEAGGFFSDTKQLIEKYNYMLEKDFLKEEAKEILSKRQEEALVYINEMLAPGGELNGPDTRTPERIKKHLDKAFGVEMDKLLGKVKPADKLKVGKNGRSNVYLKDLVTKEAHMWTQVEFPYISESTVNHSYVRDRQKEIMTRVLKAMNDGYPVVFNLILNQKGLDKATSSFRGDLLDGPGPEKETGGHMVIAEDYVIDNVPGHGTLGEGDMTPELKEAALGGNIRYIKVKNSWGISEENLDANGYYNFYSDYLIEAHDFRNPNTGRISRRSGLQSVVLPAGY